MWLLPSLDRPKNLARFFAAYRETGGSTPGAVLVDRADWAKNAAAYGAINLPPNWFFWRTVGVTQGDKLREVWHTVEKCVWLGLIGDDCIPETKGWDRRLIGKLDGTNFVSCDDGWQAPKRVGNCWAISGEVVRAVGYIFPPGLHHLFVDDVWEELGREARCWTLDMSTRVRHAHVMKGEAEPDDTHRAAYGDGFTELRGPDRIKGLWASDEAAFAAWRDGDKRQAVAAIAALRPDRQVLAIAAAPISEGDAEQDQRLKTARSKSVFIATPIARHPTHQYDRSLVQTTALLTSLGMRWRAHNIIGFSNLPRARNDLVAHFLASDYTDLLFIDDDMGWDANSVIRLLASDKPVIGGVGCKKVELPDNDPAKWCMRAWADPLLRQDEMGNINVMGVGTGLLKIERHVFETMIAAHPEWKRKGWPRMPEEVKRWCYRFFCFPDDDEDEPGEDIEFCNRWLALGGEVWVDPTIRLRHVGEKEYIGDFTALLEPAK